MSQTLSIARRNSLTLTAILKSYHYGNVSLASLGQGKLLSIIYAILFLNTIINVPMLIGELWPFFNWQSSISRQIRHVFQCMCSRARANDAINYCSYSVIRRTVFFKKFLISTKNYGQSVGASYRRIFSRDICFGSQLLVRIQVNKRTHTGGHWLL